MTKLATSLMLLYNILIHEIESFQGIFLLNISNGKLLVL